MVAARRRLTAVLAGLCLAAVAIPVGANPAAAGPGASYLRGGERLTGGQSIISPNRQYQLVMQTDGNLVLYAGSRVLWHTGTHGQSGNRLEMQTDGNLVIYGSASQVRWQTQTNGRSGARLELQSDGNLVLYASTGGALWQTDTWVPDSTLESGATLGGGQALTSPNRQYRVVMQTDGNLVIYTGSRSLWQSGTSGQSGNRLVMQTDGNLVIYGSANQVRWQTQTNGRSGARLEMQSDGNLVLYQGSTALWQSGTRALSYSLPLPRAMAPRSEYDDPHHDYPAIDLQVPTGTPALAVVAGTVRHNNNSSCGNGLVLSAPSIGAEFTYCHFSAHRVASGATVSAGAHIGDTGNTGNSTGPHLHLGISAGGAARCPQPWLLAVYDGATPPAPASLPTSGCSY